MSRILDKALNCEGCGVELTGRKWRFCSPCSAENIRKKARVRYFTAVGETSRETEITGVPRLPGYAETMRGRIF